MEILPLVQFRLHRSPFLRSIGVDEGVREDPIQPGPEIRPLLEPPEAPIRLQVGLLDEILGIGGIPAHAQRRGVERRHELHRLLGELCLISHESPRGESNS